MYPRPPKNPVPRWRPGSAFHEGALCAAVLDSATLPWRLARDPPPSPLGPPLGAADMHSVVQLLVRHSLAASFQNTPLGIPQIFTP